MKFLHLLAPAALFLSGCAGYRLGAIKPTLMANVKTIAVPVFENETLEPRIEVLVSNTIIKQFQQDGTYKIVSAADADVVLQGKIHELRRRSARSVRGNVLATKEFTDTVVLEFKLIKRSTGEIIDRGVVSGQTSFFVSGDIQQDERQAIPLAAQDAAERLVVRLSEGW